MSVERMPSSVGPFHILGDKPIGEGGMGTVYLGERREPFRQRVALKVIKLGMATEEVLARFEIERAALAMMDHPNIAKIHDAGTTSDGRPYFAMEYVPGLPITKYSDERKLSVPDRLRLFQQICAGVEHAHHKGVIHRDIKPNNLLVADSDSGPSAKIIDFGLARATNHSLSDHSVFTRPGLLLGTAEYASPEQAGRAPDIDIRTDVYSLGVVLYELLTGALPFRRSQLLGVPYDRMLEIIRDEEPQRPSTKLSNHVDPDAMAKLRQTVLPDLRRCLRRELDWIVLRCLEKDRNRRYSAVSALASDIERYLTNRPIEARPPELLYVMSKLARQYRPQMLAALVSFLAMAIGFVVAASLWQMEARAAKQRADTVFQQSLALKEHAATIARQNEQIALKEQIAAARLEDIDRFARMTELRSTLDQINAEFGDLLKTTQYHEIESWLQKAAQVLTEDAKLEIALAELRRRGRHVGQSTYLTDAEVARIELELKVLRTAVDVHEGRQSLEIPTLPQSDLNSTVDLLTGRAWARVCPAAKERKCFGEEPLAVALAEAAVDLCRSSNQDLSLLPALDTLMWARFSVGHFHESKVVAQQTIGITHGRHREVRRRAQQDLDFTISNIQRSIEDLDLRRRARMAEIDLKVPYQFDGPSDRVLFDQLCRLRLDVASFRHGPFQIARQLASWAIRDKRAVTDGTSAWEVVRRSMRGDGPDCDVRYRSIDLRPQVGLVPIGVNPTTKLWEFYHLRSGDDETNVPKHNADGSCDISAATGIIFVLIPGGTFYMGAQPDSADQVNFDRRAELNEQPVKRVSLAPFFLARHEMTQAQWKRLTYGGTPSNYVAGTWKFGCSVVWTNPVENVSWTECNECLERHGLTLPTEAQWEYACRAGMCEPWSFGGEQGNMEWYGNVADQAALKQQWSHEAWNDGHVVHAPVGLFRANGFGLYDMHGNVSEWTKDYMCEYRVEPRSGDGLRQEPSRQHVHRGGNYSDPAQKARSSHRGGHGPGTTAPVLGVRAARAVQG